MTEDKPDKIAEVLNLYNDVEDIIEVTTPPSVPAPQSPDNSQQTQDFLEVRSNLKSLIDKNMDAIDELMQVANESQAARAYEVAAKLIDSCVQANEKLLDLHRKQKEIDVLSGSSGTTVNNNSIFVGSTKELMELLKKSRKTE